MCIENKYYTQHACAYLLVHSRINITDAHKESFTIEAIFPDVWCFFYEIIIITNII